MAFEHHFEHHEHFYTIATPKKSGMAMVFLFTKSLQIWQVFQLFLFADHQ